jgi:hypothetical protein
MMDAFEDFAKAHEKTIAFIEAFSTLSAVIVSLVLAFASRRQVQTHLNCRVQYASDYSQQGHRAYVTVDITNIGVLPLRIPGSFFIYVLPFTRTARRVVPLDQLDRDQSIPPKIYPVEIPPRSRETFIIGLREPFWVGFHNMVTQTRGITRLMFRFVRLKIIADDGIRFAPELDPDFRREFRRHKASIFKREG